MTIPINPTLAARFWAKVDKRGPEDCWNWTGSTRRGHGQLWVGGGRVLGAHRISLTLHGVEVPPGKDELCVDHTCRNRACVNPAHLRLVTPKVNALENNTSPFARNAAKKTCSKGHDITCPGAYAWILGRGGYGSPVMQRQCLTCFPNFWNHPNRFFITV